jgi:hypothetical protein
MSVHPPWNRYIHKHGKYNKHKTWVNLSREARKKVKHLGILIKCTQKLSFVKVNTKDNLVMYICHIICTHHLLLRRVSLFQNPKFLSTKTWPFLSCFVIKSPTSELELNLTENMTLLSYFVTKSTPSKWEVHITKNRTLDPLSLLQPTRHQDMASLTIPSLSGWLLMPFLVV